jgi:hypothetical protein
LSSEGLQWFKIKKKKTFSQQIKINMYKLLNRSIFLFEYHEEGHFVFRFL